MASRSGTTTAAAGRHSCSCTGIPSASRCGGPRSSTSADPGGASSLRTCAATARPPSPQARRPCTSLPTTSRRCSTTSRSTASSSEACRWAARSSWSSSSCSAPHRGTGARRHIGAGGDRGRQGAAQRDGRPPPAGGHAPLRRRGALEDGGALQRPGPAGRGRAPRLRVPPRHFGAARNAPTISRFFRGLPCRRSSWWVVTMSSPRSATRSSCTTAWRTGRCRHRQGSAHAQPRTPGRVQSRARQVPRLSEDLGVEEPLDSPPG
jgi:hypothetical protein